MKLYSMDIGTDFCVEIKDPELEMTYQEKRLANRDAKQELWDKRNKYKIQPYHMMTGDDDWRELR